jgi:RNA polymerase sigma-70 factor (family 1)
MDEKNPEIPPFSASAMDYKEIQREAELLQRTAHGDESAFRDLFAIYQPSLLYLVHKIIRDMRTSEEIVQDIFLKIWLTRDNLTDIKNFKNYLFIISRNQSLNLLDKELRLRHKQAEYENDLSVVDDTGAEGLPYHLIDEAIHRLPNQQKTAWLFSRHEGLSYEAIGGQMGLSVKTVKRHIRLANDSIREYLVIHGNELLLLLLICNYL